MNVNECVDALNKVKVVDCSGIECHVCKLCVSKDNKQFRSTYWTGCVVAAIIDVLDLSTDEA